MPFPSLLPSGEFANLCGVSRELLIHYDKIGLLKPKEVRENGYRYYALEQLYLFDAIRFFMDTGMTARETIDYFEHRTTDRFLAQISNNIDHMKRQRDMLDARIGMMEKMRYITQRALSFPKDAPRLALWDELCFATTSVDESDEQDNYLQAMGRHSDYCRNVLGMSTFPFGRIVDIADWSRPGEQRLAKLSTWISEPKNNDPLDGRLTRKPKGTYAVVLHQGGTDTLSSSYEKLGRFLASEGLEPCGPAFELDMNSYLMSESPEDYLIHLSVLVKS